MKLPSGDVILASAARFLIDGKEEEAASVLLSCSLNLRSFGNECHISSDESFFVGEGGEVVGVDLAGSRAAFEILKNSRDELTQAIHRAIRAVLPPYLVLQGIFEHVETVDIDPHWREELLEIARGKGVHNQGIPIEGGRALIWKNLRFRSQSETRIAQALERVGVLFLPNCLARLGAESGRSNKEADFLVCLDGK